MKNIIGILIITFAMFMQGQALSQENVTLYLDSSTNFIEGVFSIVDGSSGAEVARSESFSGSPLSATIDVSNLPSKPTYYLCFNGYPLDLSSCACKSTAQYVLPNNQVAILDVSTIAMWSGEGCISD